ncbi:MAG: hypothetical protein RL376_1722, partial [Verrucomicrobiota bacterium]
MISWIQRTFQQHFKWLFLILLGVVIVSFVFITNASSGLGSGGQSKLPPRPFLDLDLSKVEDQRRLGSDGQLSVYLRYNPGRDVPESQLSQYALRRHATLHLANRVGLPEPTEAQLVEHIRTLRAFAGPDGKFEAKRYADFIDSLRTNPRLTEAEASRVIAEDARITAYEKLLAGPGYVLPADVSEILARRDTVWSLAIATVDGAAFAPRIDTTDLTLKPWFEANPRRYEIPARTSVAALRISATALADAASFTEVELRAAYTANPSRYPYSPAAPVKIDPATGEDANAAAAFAAARPLVEADLRKQRAEKAALDLAADLAVQLLERGVKPAALPSFLASQKNVTLTEAGPVGTDSIPAELGGNTATAIANEALRLSADRPYSNPVAIPGGAAILIWRENLPARTPGFEEVRARAVTDYLNSEKRRLFNEAGQKLRAAVNTALAAGQPFAAAVNTAATAAGLKAEVKTPEPFAISGQFPADVSYNALQILNTLAKGKLSEFLPTGETSGELVYALDQKLPAIDPASPAYASLREDLAENLG